jgi:hypothetical protein
MLSVILQKALPPASAYYGNHRLPIPPPNHSPTFSLLALCQITLPDAQTGVLNPQYHLIGRA